MKKLPDDIPTKKVLFQIAIIIISVISICAIGIIYAKCGKSSELSGPSKPIDPSLGKIEYLPTCKECYAKKVSLRKLWENQATLKNILDEVNIR